jgi:hypothetical protein
MIISIPVLPGQFPSSDLKPQSVESNGSRPTWEELKGFLDCRLSTKS